MEDRWRCVFRGLQFHPLPHGGSVISDIPSSSQITTQNVHHRLLPTGADELLGGHIGQVSHRHSVLCLVEAVRCLSSHKVILIRFLFVFTWTPPVKFTKRSEVPILLCKNDPQPSDVSVKVLN